VEPWPSRFPPIVILEVERHKDLLRAFNPLKPPQWLPNPSNLRLKKAIGTLDRFIFRMVDERRKRGARRGIRSGYE